MIKYNGDKWLVMARLGNTFIVVGWSSSREQAEMMAQSLL